MDVHASEMVPWLDGIYIQDCFVIKELQVVISKSRDQETVPRHLILTGRNGSGKSSILQALGNIITENRNQGPRTATRSCSLNPMHWAKQENGKYDLIDWPLVWPHTKHYLYASFAADRIAVKATTAEQVEKDLKENPIYSLDTVGMEFERFMLSLKFSSLFSKEQQNHEMTAYYDAFFEKVIGVCKHVLEDEKLSLDYDMQRLTFSFIFGDGRKVNVRNLADGYFSFAMIMLNLFARQEDIRREIDDRQAQVPGIVLIDEPELHLHLDLQYQIMPMLIELFPKVQFIVATHSPAVISSIRNATVYDLTKREYAPPYVAGESYSSLMETHFGLENEFGPVADELINQVKHIYLNGGTKQEKSVAIRNVMEHFSDIITPTLRVELESTIIQLETQGEAR